MQISSPLPYFVLWSLFFLLAFALSSMTRWGGSPQRPSGEFYPAIEGLRGILALNVFFHHSLITYYYLKTGAWTLPPSNFYAQMGPSSVSMFFFVTGFLFWTKLIASPKGLQTRKFLVKRWRRLMPAYLGSVGVTLLIIAVKSNFCLLVPVRKLGKELASYALCGVPFGFPGINAFSSGIADVYWSLRIEWVFYLLLPFLGWFACKKRVATLFLLCWGVIALLSAAGNPANARIAEVSSLLNSFSWYMIHCFSVGILTAHLKASLKDCPALRKPFCTAIAALLVLGVLFFVPPRYGFLESVLLLPVFVMIVFGNDFHGLLTSRPIVYLGTISYSLYLLHGSVLYVITQSVNRYVNLASLSPVTYWAIMGLIGGIVILFSSLSYRFLELPFIRRSQGAAQRTYQRVLEPVI